MSGDILLAPPSGRYKLDVVDGMLARRLVTPPRHMATQWRPSSCARDILQRGTLLGARYLNLTGAPRGVQPALPAETRLSAIFVGCAVGG